jgi:hypothetical protein
MASLVLSHLLPDGFRRADLRCHLAELSGRPPQTLGSDAMTYQLRRLRLRGMIQRLPNTHRYNVTDTGFRAALFFTRTYSRLLRPGYAAALPGHRSIPNPFKHAFDKIDACSLRPSPTRICRMKLDTFTSLSLPKRS